jgi:hypothetical protein
MAAGTIAPDIDMPTPTPANMPAAPPGAQASPSQPAAPGAAPLSGPPTPGGIAQGTGNTKGEINTPPVKLKFAEPDKLAKANTTLEVLNAATADSRTKYMSWWEKTHGDIDDKFDNMRTQLGARPSDDEPQSKKEKFAALLEFGLHLMKNSAAPSQNQGAVLSGTLSDEHDAMTKAHQDKITKAQGDYDTAAAGIETARGKEQAGIGTPAAAQKASSDQAKGDSAAVKDQASALKSINDVDTTKAATLGAPTYAVDKDNTLHILSRDEDGKGATATPVKSGIDGKPFQGRVLGKEAGSGIDKGDPAAVRTYKYATGVLGIEPETATRILGFKPTGNANADHTSVYKSALAESLDEKTAQRTADQYITNKYGANALAKVNAPIIPDAPPPAALQGLERGKVRHFGAKGSWTLGIDGKPIKVPAGSLAGGAPQTTQ